MFPTRKRSIAQPALVAGVAALSLAAGPPAPAAKARADAATASGFETTAGAAKSRSKAKSKAKPRAKAKAAPARYASCGTYMYRDRKTGRCVDSRVTPPPKKK